MRVIGIDCGLDGAIVTLEGGRIKSMVAMPSIYDLLLRNH